MAKKLMNAEKWLKLATCKYRGSDDRYDKFKSIHGGYASNAMVIHHAAELDQSCHCHYCNNGMTPDFPAYIPKFWSVNFRSETRRFLGAIRDSECDTVTIRRLSDSEIEINGEKYATSLEYSRGTNGLQVALNKKFLANALRGMGESFTLCFQAHNAAVLIQNDDATRQAAIMPIVNRQ